MVAVAPDLPPRPQKVPFVSKPASKPASKPNARRPAARTRVKTAPAEPAGVSRPLVVAAALAAALGLTAGLLAWASPSPLAPDAVGRLLATSDSPTPSGGVFEPVFETARPVVAGRWRKIYVHQSGTAGGDAATLADAAAVWGVSGPADHFVIGNGQGAGDGEVQFTPRWDEQRPAAPPAAGAGVDAACVSVCLVGDFDRGRPSEAQLARLRGLLSALCRRLDIPPANVRISRATPRARASAWAATSRRCGSGAG